MNIRCIAIGKIHEEMDNTKIKRKTEKRKRNFSGAGKIRGRRNEIERETVKKGRSKKHKKKNR